VVVAVARLATGDPRLPAVDPLVRFLLAVAVIVCLCHLLGALVARLHQPPVVGEILGGLVLGPSVLGALWPSGQGWLFPSEVTAAVHMAAELGLVLFVFMLGCELRPGLLRTHRGAVPLVVAGAMGLPFLAGAGVAWWGRDLLTGPAHPVLLQVGFVGLAMAITALPVLARILVDLGLAGSRLGTLALACAATGDGIMWIALSLVLGVAGVGGVDPVLTTAAVGVFLVATLGYGRRALARAVGWAESRPAVSRHLLPMLVAAVLAFAAAAQLAGLHAVIGALLFGLLLPDGSATVKQARGQLRGFTMTVLLPLFFAGVGLETTVGVLGDSAGAWALFAAVLLVATATKLAGAAGGGLLAGLPAREALRLGALLNCRGVTELVVVAIGFQLGLVSATGLTMLVLMALITTAVTGPAMRLLGRSPGGGGPVMT
jgi:Kef-type K+ transport system membrane component KefB